MYTSWPRLFIREICFCMAGITWLIFHVIVLSNLLSCTIARSLMTLAWWSKQQRKKLAIQCGTAPAKLTLLAVLVHGFCMNICTKVKSRQKLLPPALKSLPSYICHHFKLQSCRLVTCRHYLTLIAAASFDSINLSIHVMK